MRRAIATACVLAMMAGGVRAQTSNPQSPTVHSSSKVHKAHNTTAAKKKKHKTANAKQKAEAPAQPLPAQTMPPVPATLMNSAPVKPNVTMEGGLLTIDAPNSTLSDVLSGVQKATGARIEGASPTERVAVRLGPGEPEQVIAALLRGTPYDYVILGSLEHKDVVTRVVLTQSSTSSSSASSSPAPPPATSDTEPEQEPDVSGPVSPGRRTGISPHQPQTGNTQDAAPQPNAESEQPQAQQPQPQAQPAQSQQDQLLKQLQQLGLAAPKPTQ